MMSIDQRPSPQAADFKIVEIGRKCFTDLQTAMAGNGGSGLEATLLDMDTSDGKGVKLVYHPQSGETTQIHRLCVSPRDGSLAGIALNFGRGDEVEAQRALSSLLENVAVVVKQGFAGQWPFSFPVSE